MEPTFEQLAAKETLQSELDALWAEFAAAQDAQKREAILDAVKSAVVTYVSTFLD